MLSNDDNKKGISNYSVELHKGKVSCKNIFYNY